MLADIIILPVQIEVEILFALSDGGAPRFKVGVEAVVDEDMGVSVGVDPAQEVVDIGDTGTSGVEGVKEGFIPVKVFGPK